MIPDYIRELDQLSAQAGAAMVAANVDAQPTNILGQRLCSEPVVAEWVSRLQRLEGRFREAKAQELTRGRRGVGQRVLVELLLRAADDGMGRLATAGAFAAFMDSERQLHDPQREPKSGKHDRVDSLERTADRIVRALVAYPAGIEPTDNPKAAKRSEQRLLQEVAAHILREDPPASPARRRRTQQLRLDSV